MIQSGLILVLPDEAWSWGSMKLQLFQPQGTMGVQGNWWNPKRPPNPADPDPLHQPGLLNRSSSPGLLRLESAESSLPEYSLSGPSPPWRMGWGSDAV